MDKMISVVIPAYNAQETIQRAVESILGEDIEIVIVIDGATDNTLKICQNMQKNNNKIRIIEQVNKGLLEARNTGIRHAEGKYIMFLDADDCYFEHTINRIQEIIKKYNEPDLIRFRYQKIPSGYEQYKYIEEDEKEILSKDFPTEVYPMFLTGYMLNATWSNCVKREIATKVEISANYIHYGEDLIRNLETFSNIKNLVFVNDVLYKYVYQEDSMTNSRNIERLFKNLEDSIEVYSLLHVYLKRWNMDTKENIDIVNNRIKKESNQLIELIKQTQFFFKPH